MTDGPAAGEGSRAVCAAGEESANAGECSTARVRDFGPKGRDPMAVSSGLDSVGERCLLAYGAEARPRRSRGHAQTRRNKPFQDRLKSRVVEPRRTLPTL